MGFSLELEELLTELRRRRWTLIRWGPEHAVDLLAATFRWDDCTDVLILRNNEHATAYRVPNSAEVFNPEVVWYQYHNNPLWTLRAILSLPVPEESARVLETPRQCRIPGNLPKPTLIRPLSYC